MSEEPPTVGPGQIVDLEFGVEYVPEPRRAGRHPRPHLPSRREFQACRMWDALNQAKGYLERRTPDAPRAALAALRQALELVELEPVGPEAEDPDLRNPMLPTVLMERFDAARRDGTLGWVDASDLARRCGFVSLAEARALGAFDGIDVDPAGGQP